MRATVSTFALVARRARRGFIAALAVILFAPLVAGAQVVTTRTVVSGASQTVGLGTVLPERFAVRVTGPDALPIAGVAVRFAIAFCLVGVPAPGEPCIQPGFYGRWVGTTDGFVAVTTDANGIAATPAFIAGTVAGQYRIYTTIAAQTVGGVPIAAASALEQFTVQQVRLSAAVPAGGGWMLALMALALLVVASRRVRARR